MKRISLFAFAVLATLASCSKAEIDAPESNGQELPEVNLADGQILCAIQKPRQPLMQI